MAEEIVPDSRQPEWYVRCTKGTWILLGIAVVCLCVDVYAVFYQPHYPSTAPGEPYIKPLLSPAVVWALEIALALLSFWLIRIAFTKIPPAQPAS